MRPRKLSQGENRTKKELEHGCVLPKITLVDGGERDFGVECSVVFPDASFQTLNIFWHPGLELFSAMKRHVCGRCVHPVATITVKDIFFLCPEMRRNF